MSLRVPGASTPARFWRNLVEGRDCLSRPSAAALRRFGVAQDLIANPDFVRALPTLADADRFDAAFFDLSTSEAEVTEPRTGCSSSARGRRSSRPASCRAGVRR